jgi:mRNA interferase RelE/StbE
VTKYAIEVMPVAKKALFSIQKKEAQRVVEKISSLAEDPRPRWTEKLKARSGYRTSAGNYRIIYSVDDDKKLVSVLSIGDRKDVYRH